MSLHIRSKVLLTGAITLLFALPVHAQLAAPNEAGVSFAHVHLNVADIEVHKKLWVEQFDGALVVGDLFTAVKLPGMFVFLTETEPSAGSQGSVVDHFGFKVPDLDEALAAWRDAGLEVQSEFTGGEGSDNAFLMAPDGVKIELQEDASLEVKAEAYHVHIFTEGHIELLDWYIDTFSAVKRARGTHLNTADVPGINLSFEARRDRAPTQGRAIDHIGFEVENLEAFCKVLEKRGIEFQRSYRYVESFEVAIAFFVDQSGVRVELTEGLGKW